MDCSNHATKHKMENALVLVISSLCCLSFMHSPMLYSLELSFQL
jgi:hypothetical protein